ncbi:MAG: RluA family pseudouridine synthase [Acidobacteria bacterium]|nr:RluA family pseudouridine synthase [Acidobacteriota bacterium]
MDLIVAREEDRLSVKTFLTRRFSGLSQMYLRARVYQGHCFLDGELVENWGRKLKPGQIVSIEVDLEAATSRKPEAIPLEILFEDEHRIVVAKPGGMLVHPTMHVKTGTLANALASHLKGARFWFPHRLDQETSGVLVVAKTEIELRSITRAWESGQVAKLYLAVLEGTVEPDELLIDAPIGRDPEAKPAWGVRASGKPAQSRLRVTSRHSNMTHVQLEPITGRTNQLRIHCAHIGHPILGDRLYGTPGSRMFLHAHQLSLLGQTYQTPPPWQLFED